MVVEFFIRFTLLEFSFLGRKGENSSISLSNKTLCRRCIETFLDLLFSEEQKP